MLRSHRLLLPGGGIPPVSPVSCGHLPLAHFLKHLLGGHAGVSHAAADPCSLTLHFLRSSCGLSEPAVAKIAGRVHLRSTKRAHAVLALFRGLGLAGADLARVVAAAPEMLNYRADAVLAPKLDFFRRDLGLTDDHIRKTILANPYRSLCYSLEGRLRPNYLLLRELLGTDQNVRSAVKQSFELIHGNVRSDLLPKVKILRDHGATDAVIVKLVTTHPRSLIHRLSPVTWKRRIDNYLSLGWTEELVKLAFVRHPYCMSVSDDKVRRISHFFADKLGWSPEYVSASPMLISLSYEKRLLPRYQVLDILVSRGVIQRIRISHLILGEKKFMEKYVTGYQQTIPEVLEAYRGAGTDSAVTVK
ncbi:hypothetical protein CFC21_003210 [Triticum aestivum]|uniref:Uncharacterized protein n=1 Tax=Triticum aestivum TaxID=4565 RepID=A0A3B5Y3Y7_WHEAT|nr:hypothetical protein CFC21_003210 [Triticum aestivum]